MRPKSACGGEATTSDSTPAASAGMTFMSTDDGYTALPPGTYRPTRRIGIHFSLTTPPGTTSTETSEGFCASWNFRMRPMDSSRAARTSASSPANASAMTSAGTTSESGRTRSNFSE